MAIKASCLECRWATSGSFIMVGAEVCQHERLCAGKPETLEVSRKFLEALFESDECYIDINWGGCVEHAFPLKSGEKCPQQELRELLYGN